MTFTNSDHDDGFTIPTPPSAEASRRYQASRDAAEAEQDRQYLRAQLGADLAGFVGIVAGVGLIVLIVAHYAGLLH